jgi:hypothetical protein
MGLQIVFGKSYYNEGQIGWFVASSALNLIAAAGNINKPAILYSSLRKRFFMFLPFLRAISC